MLRRLILGFGANALGQVVTIIIQIVSLPLFLLFWDTSTYGWWLLLSALPSYLGIADVGIVSVAGNKMTMDMARGDVHAANVAFHSAHLFLVIVCSGLAAVLGPAALFWPGPPNWTMDMRLCLAALLGGVLATLYGGLADAVFKATERYPLGTFIGQMIRLGEWGGYMVGLVLFRSFAGVALVGFLARAVGTGLATVVAQRGQTGLAFGFRNASATELLRMIRPALFFAAFPLANALSFQAVTLIVGGLAGASAVALFNTYRTIARVAVQLTSIFSHALWPEFARLFGHGGMKANKVLFVRWMWLGGAVAVGFSPVLYFASPWLLAIWTHGRIPFEPTLMAILLAYAAVGGLWHVPRVLLMATNQHIALSTWSLLASILCAALTWLLGLRWDVRGAGFAMLISEAFIASVCIHLAYRAFRPTRSRSQRHREVTLDQTFEG